MTKILGKVLTVKKNEEKGNYMLSFADDKYNTFYVNTKVENAEDLINSKIEMLVIGSGKFFNHANEDIKVIEKDTKEMRSEVSNILDNVKIIDILEGEDKKTNSKYLTFVTMNNNNKIIKLKCKKFYTKTSLEKMIGGVYNFKGIKIFEINNNKFYQIEDIKGFISEVKN